MNGVRIAVLVVALVWPGLAAAEDAPAGDFESQVLVIRTYDQASESPVETITIPLSVLKVAAKILPTAIRAQLEADGISVEEVVRLAEEENLRGPIARIDDGRTGERTTFTIE